MSLDIVTMIGKPTAISVAFKTQKDHGSEPVEGISIVGEKQLSADEMITAERFIPLNNLALDDSLRDEIGSAAAGVYSELNKPDEVLNFVDSEFSHCAVDESYGESLWPSMWYELW